jgi:hypothetical protein
MNDGDKSLPFRLPGSRARPKGVLWALTLTFPLVAAVIGIDLVGYRTIPTLSVISEGDPIIAFDPEIGFVPSPRGRSKRTHFVGERKLEYHLYTDRRGARVTGPDAQTDDRVKLLFVGDSFTWGHGVEAEDSFAHGVGKQLDASSANLAMGSYGTAHSLQMLRRNLDLAPKVVVYPFIDSHLQRNLAPCAAAFYPFCLDQSHVRWREGRAEIAAPFSNGVRRAQLHVEAQQRGLWPLAWVIHGLDVALGRFLLQTASRRVDDPDKQTAALEFLLGEMSNAAKSADAKLLIVHIPFTQMTAAPDALRRAATNLQLEVLDLSPVFQRHRGAALYIPVDGHPTVAGHAVIADQIAAFVRARRWLD